MFARIAMLAGLGGLAVSAASAQSGEEAVLVKVDDGVEIEFRGDAREAERDLAAKVELAARMACADSWRPRSTIYESIDYTVDWPAADGAMPGRRKAVARNISVRCRL